MENFFRTCIFHPCIFVLTYSVLAYSILRYFRFPYLSFQSFSSVRWPCGVCSKGVGSSSLQCTSCHKWVHKKCSGIKGSMSKVAKSFICRACLNPVTSAGHTSVDIGASAKLELVDKFCYVSDMLSVDGDADAAVEARIRIGWNKFK